MCLLQDNNTCIEHLELCFCYPEQACADDETRTHKFQCLELLPIPMFSYICILVRMTGVEPARLSTIVSRTIMCYQFHHIPKLVLSMGVEPTRLTAHVPKTCRSTSSLTIGCCVHSRSRTDTPFDTGFLDQLGYQLQHMDKLLLN